jgi:putative ABC transport system permease protein
MIRDGIRRAFSLALRRRDRWERDVEDEIELHLTLRAEQLLAEGRAPADAYAEAVHRFGPLNDSRARLLKAAEQRERAMRRVELVDDLRQDLSFTLRTLKRQKGWTAVAVITLALGIGAATAVFSVASRLLLHPLPYPDADRVVFVDMRERAAASSAVRLSSPPPLVRFWAQHNRSLETMEVYHTGVTMLKTIGDPSLLSGSWVSSSFASFAGQRPLRGRNFSSDEQRSRAHVVLLAEPLWRERFAADDHVIGRAITLDDSAYVIIGVMPSSLRMPLSANADPDVWLPLDAENNRIGVQIIARMRKGVPLADATRELDSLAVRSGVFPSKNLPWVTQLVTPSKAVSFHDSLVMLCVAVGLVLLVACTNVAHLVLSRGAARQREFAVRASLGAGRGRLARQLVTESLVLAATGCAAGVLIGQAVLAVLVRTRPTQLWELTGARLDATTLLAAVAAAVLTSVAFALLGLVQLARGSPGDALTSGRLAGASPRRGERLRSALVVSEMALSGMLVVGAALLLRSILNLQRTDVGFTPSRLYSVGMFLPQARYPNAASREALMSQLVDGLRQLRGVREVVLSAVGPYGRTTQIGSLEVAGERAPVPPAEGFVDMNGVQSAYFRTMGIRFLEGRTFTDTSNASREVIVNAGYARRHWKPGAAVGQRLHLVYEGRPMDDWMTVVGVAADAMLTGPVAETSSPLLYRPWSDASQPTIMFRTDGSIDPVVPVRSLVRAVDPRMPPPFVVDMEKLVVASQARPRFVMLLLSGFTLIATVLAAVGLYGVMAYSVLQRTREIGIRVALGATHGNIARAVLARGATLAALGAVFGLAGAYWATHLLATLLYNVSPLDRVSFGTGAAVLVLTSLIACVAPARRVLAVDPVTAIRAE